MTVTYATFIAEYTEFAETGEAIVAPKIATAILETPSDVWGVLTDKGVALRAAHALASGPNGGNSRIKGTAETIYSRELAEYVTKVTCGVGRVA